MNALLDDLKNLVERYSRLGFAHRDELARKLVRRLCETLGADPIAQWVEEWRKQTAEEEP